MNQNSKMLIGAVIAAALAIAVYYGLINQQTANNIQGQANQTLGTSPAAQQQPAPANARPSTTASAPASPYPQSTSPAAPANQATVPQATVPQSTAPAAPQPQNTAPAPQH